LESAISIHDATRRPESAAWFVRPGPQPCPAAPGALSDLLHVLRAAVAAGPDESAFLVAPRRVRGGAMLFPEGAPADAVHVVRSGTFKCVKSSEDGYEQVLSFAGRGAVLGFEAIARGGQPTAAVALEESSVYTLPLAELDLWRRRYPALDRGLQMALSRQLAGAGEIVEMMAAVAAEVRLARFLVWHSARMAEQGLSPRRLRLRMSRRDIASLLGVAHETVSRSFTALAEWGYLHVDNRDVEIVDLDGLRAAGRCTRGMAVGPAGALRVAA
jgi:CRP/FNR family transcriptional regulator